MKAVYSFTTVLMLLMTMTASGAERFFNLTADQVRVDSVIPYVGFNMPLPEGYQDSIYTAEILYPEFIDMAASDIRNFERISAAQLPELPLLSQTVVMAGKKPSLFFSLSPLVMRDGQYKFLVSYMLKVTSVKRASAKAKKAGVPTERYASSSVLASGSWAKIRVPSTGVFELTDAVIKTAGFTDLSKVKIYGYGGNMIPETLSGEYLAEYDDLEEIPTSIVNGKRLFWANGPVSWASNTTSLRTRNPYSQYGYYFITQNSATPKTITEQEFLNAYYPNAKDYHSLYEVDEYAWMEGGRNLVEGKETSVGSTREVSIANPSSDTEGTLVVVVTTDEASSFSISLNGKALGNGTTKKPEHIIAGWSTMTYKVDNLQAVNNVSVKLNSGNKMRLDYVALTTASPAAAPDLKAGTFPAPEYVHNITNQNHHADSNVDMVIIIPTSQLFLSQAQRLATFHEQHDGMSVRIVPADELYNEFSSGTPDVSAYRRYMKMMYDRGGNLPKYLLLFGDCYWDNRLLTQACRTASADNLLLCYQSENSYSEVDSYVSDDFIACLDDNELLATEERALGIPDIAVGRFPVNTYQQAKVMVDKTINYANNSNAGTWQNTIMFMADDGNDNMHMRDIDVVAEDVLKDRPGYNVRKVYWDAYKGIVSASGISYPEVTNVIKAQQQAGALIMDYGGHGGPASISAEQVLKLTDFAGFTNTNLPLWITASCEIMPFDGTKSNIGETAVLNPNGGAVAFYGTTTTVYANYNKHINQQYIKYVLADDEDGKPMTIGGASRRAKEHLVTESIDLSLNKLQYSLLGDPALALVRPQLRCVVDEIDGKPVSSTDKPKVKANGVMKISGRVLRNGALADDMNGLAYLTVKDRRELMTCLNNAGDVRPFQYYDRPSTLYNGSDSVRNGRFEMTFVMPRDISYSDESGLITLFARNSAKTISANGETSDFIIGGSENLENDSIGPNIHAYLNNPSFSLGDAVNRTPFFVAEIADKDGINASGAGIGHDMQLIIDGKSSQTYSLNNNFQFDFGSYTKGTTFFSIPPLTPGAHSLKFRAWDVLNNPSTVELTFNVVKGKEPVVYDVNVTENPARTTTTFIVTHDHPSALVSCTIDILDMSGRQIHKISKTSSSGNAMTIDWDLTTEAGNSLQTGVYLYRVRLSSDGSNEVSKAKKLIIIKN